MAWSMTPTSSLCCSASAAGANTNRLKIMRQARFSNTLSTALKVFENGVDFYPR
jgi:hypothetical protein